MNENDVLTLLADTGALLTGHFELRSKLHSDRFFQCANALRYPEAAEKLCQALAARVRAQLAGGGVDAVISPALGGLIVGHEVARALGVMSIFAEKADGILVMRRFSITPGARYVVAEDVVTRGGRVQETIDIVKAGGGMVMAVAVLVDRSAGTARFEVPMTSLIEMAPTVWTPAECPLCKTGSKAEHPGS
ncbi:MAG TPA: orotate phosphoribosyltransferase [Verrucomicrobia bacterium]|nr:orotate phosphoribosyltransferase [Verrucomicrobiota bacterium]